MNNIAYDSEFGYWEKGSILHTIFGLAKCSKCGVSNERTNYCPHCGDPKIVERSKE